MLNIINMDLKSIETREAFIINKKKLDGDKLKLTISRSYKQHDCENDIYIGNCIAELKLASEEQLNMLNCSFYVKISMQGTFHCLAPESKQTTENVNSAIMFELLPHIRACMASMMSSAGLTPYLIPNSIISEF